MIRNKNLKVLIKNFGYSLGSNSLSLIISSLVVLIFPKLLGVEEYGYWQLYLFYKTYVGFSQFGWTEGLYLKFGGLKTEEIDKKYLHSQFYSFLIIQLILMIIIGMFLFNISVDIDRQYILITLLISMLLVNLSIFFQQILQATYNFKIASGIIIIEKLFFLIFILFILFLNIINYKMLIVADIIALLVSVIYGSINCKEFVYKSILDFKINLKEILDNISIGSKLFLSNMSSNLIIGTIRFGIERVWDVSVFGKISLTLSISNVVLVFISAIGNVIYPVLRRVKTEYQSIIYEVIRNILMAVVLLALILYYPLETILSIWLPQYTDSFEYMGILFPIIIFESRMGLLINPYLKSLRKEKQMLIINFFSVLISISLTAIFAFSLNNLSLTILSILVSIGLRAGLQEYLLSRIIDIRFKRDFLIEIVMVIIFVFSTVFLKDGISFLIYSISYILYIIIKRKDIISSINQIKKILT